MGLFLIPILIAAAGAVLVGVAVYHERRMQRHRQPGVTYAQVTWRKDGGWRRADLFTPEGLAHQRQASRFGVTGILLWVVALFAWATLRIIGLRS